MIFVMMILKDGILITDGTPETITSNSDTDNDGLDNAYDNNDNLVNPTNSQIPTDFPDVDNTDNPERDWRETNAVVILINNVTVNEGDPALFTISLVTKNDNSILTQSASIININFSSSDGTNTATQYTVATSPYDYNQINASPISIPAYQETIIFSMPTLDDIIHELDELFTINGTITSNNTVNNQISGIATIIDNEAPPTITMNNSTEQEGVDLAHTITISHPSSTPISINIETSNDIAYSTF